MRIFKGVAILLFGIGGSVLLYEKATDEDLNDGEKEDDHYMFADDDHDRSDKIDEGNSF